MGKRRFVKALIGLGLSPSAISELTKEELLQLTDNPKKEVPRLGWYRHTNKEEVRNRSAAPNREPIYYTIPRDQWERTEAPYQAAGRISKRFNDPYIDVGVTNQGKGSGLSVLVERVEVHPRDGGKPSEKARSAGKSVSEISEAIPDSVNETVEYGGKKSTIENIPVVVEERILKEQSRRDCDEDAPPAGYYNGVYRPIPGGCEAGINPNGSARDWTLGSPAYSRNVNDYVMITAAHCINRQKGTPVHQNSKTSSNRIGESTDNYLRKGNGDAAEIKVTDSYATYSVAGSNESYYKNIGGSVDRDRIADLAYNGTEVTVQGRRTGRHYAPVANHITESDSGDKVEILAPTDGGDSGGIYFELQDGKAYTIGINAWGPCIGGKAACSGNTMYYIENALDVYV